MLYRYGTLVYHDLEERLGASWGRRAILAVTLAILLLPLMLTAGPGWLAPFWLAVTFGYQTSKERTVSVLGLLLLARRRSFRGALRRMGESDRRTLCTRLRFRA